MKESDPFLHTAAWKRARRAALERDHFKCRDCMDRYLAGYGAKPRDATMVHHIIPRDQRPDLALDLDNLISLCDECHNKRHPEKGRQAHAPAPKHGMRVIKI